MIKPIVREVFFLGQKSEEAVQKDVSIGKDLQDTLTANRDRRRMPVSGWTAQIIQHEIDHIHGIII